MASVTKSPTSCTSDTIPAVINWTDPSNALLSDSDYATTSTEALTPSDSEVRLYIEGSIAGEDKATNTPISTSESYLSYGGITDKWALTPSYAQIIDPNFGCAFLTNNVLGRYSKATGFNFQDDIPIGSVINGIQVEIQAKTTGTTLKTCNVNHFRITIYYTEPPSVCVRSMLLTSIMNLGL